MVVAFYAVLAYLDWTTAGGAKTAWEAPALDPRMLKAFALIGVELMLITATALFFSTFSSPFLSVALTFAVYVIGHFGEDLKNINTIVKSMVLPYITKAVYYVDAEPQRARRQVGGRARPCRSAARTCCWRPARALLYIATLLVGVDSDLLASRLEVDGDARRVKHSRLLWVALVVLLRRRDRHAGCARRQAPDAHRCCPACTGFSRPA